MVAVGREKWILNTKIMEMMFLKNVGKTSLLSVHVPVLIYVSVVQKFWILSHRLQFQCYLMALLKLGLAHDPELYEL